ncbi:MAG TPA: polysaccharide deacetylase family protein [Vicinamibacterales bacterium]|nr:polysaccharide deacetylase family protein [Vicinamibacterales bacterium]
MRAILTYHSLDDSGSAISMPPAVFRQHVSWMVASGVRVLPLADMLVLDRDDPAPAVSITFDDGFMNFTDAAAQLMAARLPVTLFVVTGHIGGSNAWGGRAESGIPTLPLLGWGELERLVAQGVSIGAHTRSHARLPTLPPAAVEDELDGCLQDLRTRLGVRVEHFAYPYGAADEDVAAITGARFQAAVTTRFAPLSRHDAPMWIPRFDMYYFRQPGTLESWGTPRFRRRLWSVQLRRQLREVLT